MVDTTNGINRHCFICWLGFLRCTHDMKTNDRTNEIKNEAEIDESADMWTEEELTEIRNRADLLNWGLCG